MTNRCIFFLLGLCFCFGSYGQDQNGMPIQISANEHSTTTIFFPSAISKIIHPEVHYKFEYQDDDPSIGLLKARKGSASNLTVITDNGYIYSFALQYSEKIETFNFLLSTDMSVGRIPSRRSHLEETEDGVNIEETPPESTFRNTNTSTEQIEVPPDTINSMVLAKTDDNSLMGQSPLLKDDNFDQEKAVFDEKDGEGDLYDIDRTEYYRIFCENNYLQKTVFKRTFRQNKKVMLKLNNILVDRNEIYFVLQIENNSRKEYVVNGLSFFRKTGVGQLQKIIKPLFVFNLQDKIDPQSINEVVFVYKRFTISNKEEVYVVLDELGNNRMVMLPLDNKQINVPTN